MKKWRTSCERCIFWTALSFERLGHILWFQSLIWQVEAHWPCLCICLFVSFPNRYWEGWPDKLRLAPSGHSCHIHELGGHCVQQHLRKEDWLTILHQILGSSVIGKNTVLLLVISPRENTLKANFCTEYGQPVQLGWIGSPPCGWRKDTCRRSQRGTAWKWCQRF